MTPLTNFHTHSTFDDGAESCEVMVKAAVSKGCTAFGISGHAPMCFDTSWTMTREGEQAFIREMDRLKKVYKDHITLLTGLERDYYSPTCEHVRLRYWSVHYIKKDGAMSASTM